MKKLLSILSFAVSALLSIGLAQAQLAAPNEAGVTMGHVHLNVPNVEASKEFWVSLGGAATKLGAMEVVKFPNVLIILRKADPTIATVEPVVNHLGFLVQNGQELMAKWKASGAKIEPNASGHTGLVYTPEGQRFEILEKSSLPVPIVFDQIHFFLTEPASDGGSAMAEIKTWYAKVFDAKPAPSGGSQSSPWEAEILPGVNLRFSKSATPTVGTKGRALDHIGFEIKNLEAFCKKAEANGLKFDVPYTKRPELGIALAFITDPWGTYIELTEGLDKR